MMTAKWSVLLLITLLSSTTAAPFLVRLRRSIDDVSQETSDADEQQPREAKSLSFSDPEATVIASENIKPKKTSARSRQNKALSYYDFVPQYFGGGDYDTNDDLSYDVQDDTEEDDRSRVAPSRRKQNQYKNSITNQNSLSYDNSPIYYIRLPPTPYMFVPGVGYISQPPSLGPPVPPPVNPFINVPIDFVSNGKPTNVYQWSGAPTYQPPVAIDPFSQLYSRPVSRPQQQRPTNNFGYQRPTQNKKPVDTKVTNLKKGPYNFNGKPHDVFLLRDSYNALYSDALQNFYP